MKTRDKNPMLRDMILELDRKGRDKAIWKAVAKGLNKPKRISYKVNIHQLEKAQPKETIIVPGKVLGSGLLTKELTIAALHVSTAARSKIEKAGGKVMTIPDLVEKQKAGKGIRIMG